MSNRIENLLSGVLTLAAIAIAAAFVHREFFGGPIARLAVSEPPKYDSKWTEMTATGRRMGSDHAPVTIIEFSDYECPFCRRFQKSLSAIGQRFGSKVSIVYIHFPLPMHRFAEPAALAAECAYEQGAFESISKVLFEKQDSLGLKSWTSFAIDGGVSDTSRFIVCVHNGKKTSRISEGKQLGMKIGIVGTPTVFVNRWRYSSPPTEEVLAKAVTALLAGKKPDGAQ